MAELSLLMLDDQQGDHRLLEEACARFKVSCAIERCATVETCVQALHLARKTGRVPDLLILDLAVPHASAAHLLQHIRSDPLLRAIAVIVLTASLDPVDRAACAAADHFFIKPRGADGWTNIVLLLRSVAERKALAARQGPAGASGLGRPAHLLQVDDDADDRALFAQAFARSGVGGSLHQVASVSAALLFLNRLEPYRNAPRPSLIVLDLSLPQIDGFEFLRTLRGNTRFHHLPVIVLTGSERYSDIERCRDLLVEDYVVKPRTLQELNDFVASLRRWLTSPVAETI